MQSINRPLAISSFVAIALHCCLFLLVALSFPAIETPQQKKLVVRTVKLTPSLPKESTVSEAIEPQPVAKAIEPPPVIKPTPPKPVAKKPEPTAVKPTKKKQIPTKKQELPKKQASQKTNELLAKAQASLAKIDATPGKAVSPTKLTSIEQQEIFSESLYQEELTQRIQQLLLLPEMGDIRLKVTIAKNGTIKKIEILSADSLANRNYIEKTLPQHTMPPLGKQFGNSDSHTFTITMRGI